MLKCNGENVKEHTILTCAEITAFHSKAKLSSNVPVDYCFIRNVKKPSGSKPGMVVYTNNKTLYVNPKEVWKSQWEANEGANGDGDFWLLLLKIQV